MKPSFTLGAFAVIADNEGRVLMCHRRDRDLWNLPGGAIESGELPTEAVVRETREETGLEVVVERLAGVYAKSYENDMVFVFTARIVGGELQLTDEADALAYFHPDAAPDNTIAKHLKRAIEALSGGELPVFRLETTASGTT